MTTAVIFDMDGVLLESEPLWHRAEIEVFSSVGVELDEAMCFETMGLRVDEVVAHWFARFPWSGVTPNALGEHLLDCVNGMIAMEAEPLPGLVGLLDELGRAGMRLGLATSSPTRLIDTVVDRLGVRDRFEVLHSAEFEPYGKPHPAVYLTAALRLGVAPTACTAIEDSVNGVIAAKAARMRCVAVPTPELRTDPRFAIADAVAADLGAVAALLVGAAAT